MLRVSASAVENYRYHTTKPEWFIKDPEKDAINDWIADVKAPKTQTPAMLYGLAFEQAVQFYYETNEPVKPTFTGVGDGGEQKLIDTSFIQQTLLETRLLMPQAIFQVKREKEVTANGESVQLVGKVDAVSWGSALIAEFKTTDLSRASAFDKYYESTQAEAYFMLFPEINNVLFMVTDRNTGLYERVELRRENYSEERLYDRLNDFVWAVNYYGLTDYFQPYKPKNNA
jgi:hypothetical protein